MDKTYLFGMAYITSAITQLIDMYGFKMKLGYEMNPFIRYFWTIPFGTFLISGIAITVLLFTYHIAINIHDMPNKLIKSLMIIPYFIFVFSLFVLIHDTYIVLIIH
jgi:hypothetical protein